MHTTLVIGSSRSDACAPPWGDLEHAVLAIVYELHRATAREIHERVGEPRSLIYTTTAKVLDRLHAKGQRRKEGMAFVYTADRKREVVERARIRDLLSRMLKPTPKPAMAALVDAVESLDPDLVDELARLESRTRNVTRPSGAGRSAGDWQ